MLCSYIALEPGALEQSHSNSNSFRAFAQENSCKERPAGLVFTACPKGTCSYLGMACHSLEATTEKTLFLIPIHHVSDGTAMLRSSIAANSKTL